MSQSNTSKFNQHQLEEDLFSSQDDAAGVSYNNNSSIESKQEIKTVRIVKRESKERQRDKSDKSIQNLDQVLEEELNILNEQELARKRAPKVYMQKKSTNPFMVEYDWTSSKEEIMSDNNTYPVSMTEHLNNNERKRVDNDSMLDTVTLRHKTESIQSLSKTIGELDYQSEAAKQIITEVSNNTIQKPTPPSHLNRRSTPKEKRRHNTAPHHVNVDSIELMRKIEHINKNVSLSKIRSVRLQYF